MPNYYFTFGQNHFQNDGTPMKDFYIKVTAMDYGMARIKFVEEWSSHNMPSPDKWAFQYEEDKFEPEYFPKGEYISL